MGSPFAAAVGVLFGGDLLAEDVTYTPSGGGPIATRGVFGTLDAEIGLGQTGARAPGTKCSLQTSALPADGVTFRRPRKGETITRAATGVQYVIRAVRVDPLELTVDCDLGAAS
jgi:hypothetical protein